MRPRFLLLLLCVFAALLHGPEVVSGQPTTLRIDGTAAVMDNGLVTLVLNLTNAECISLHTSLEPGVNLLYLNDAGCAWDREPPEVRPSGLTYSVISNTSDVVHVHLEDGAVPVLKNFRWSFDYALVAGVSGMYVWGTVSHPENASPETLQQYRWIARIDPGSEPGRPAPVDSVGLSTRPPMIRLLPTLAEARAGKQLSPNEAEMVTLGNGTTTAEHKYN